MRLLAHKFSAADSLTVVEVTVPRERLQHLAALLVEVWCHGPAPCVATHTYTVVVEIEILVSIRLSPPPQGQRTTGLGVAALQDLRAALERVVWTGQQALDRTECVEVNILSCRACVLLVRADSANVSAGHAFDQV